MKNLSSEIVAVLGRLVSAKLLKDKTGELAPGKHEVDFDLNVKGEFRVGDAFEQEIANKVDHKSLLAAAIDKMRQAGLKVDISELVKASLTDKAKELAKEIAAESQAVMNVIQAPTLTQCNGKVTGVKGLVVTVTKSGKEELQTA